MNGGEDFLTEEEAASLLRLARETLETFVRTGDKVDVDSYPLTDALREPHGAFVTLRMGEDLRGCIGFTTNTRPLALSVRDSCVNSASADPRFNPVAISELKDIWIEVSALKPGDTPETPFRRIENIDEIVIGRDGLYIERPAGRGGLLLPQVAVDSGWDVGQFLSAVCRKAGFADRTWEQPDATLFRFSAQVFSEERPGPEA